MAFMLGLFLSVIAMVSLALFLSSLSRLLACLSAILAVAKLRIQILKKNGWTIVLRGPRFANMDFVITSDPVNVHHILTKNCNNYPNGKEVQEVFEVLGDGIFNADDDVWKNQRKSVHSLIKNSKVELHLRNLTRRKVEKELFSVLDHFSELGTMVDIQDVFKRFTFDTYWQLVLGLDPKCLSVDFPEILFYKAFDEVEEAVFYRTTVPETWWKLQKWLQIGNEKKYTRGWRTFDKFLYEFISLKQEKLRRMKTQIQEEEELDLLTVSMVAEEGRSKTFLRDLATNLFVAGRDNVSAGMTWFFWLIATHPSVENKILEEMRAHNVQIDDQRDWSEGLNKLVYLHAAVCETLRLYPPLPISYRTAVEADTLPSGHHINQNDKLLLCYYATARMEEVWGKDCLEFKPERWISEKGSIIHVPSYKFSTFGAGPRSCLGRDFTLIQMKMVGASIIWNYRIQVPEGHSISPSNSIMLFMKDGLKVRVFKRS